MLAFLEGTITQPALGDIYNATTIDSLLDIFKKCTQALTLFPVNIFVLVSLCGLAVGLVGTMVKTFRKRP